MIGGFEGGAVYTYEKDGRYWLLVNDTAALDALGEQTGLLDMAGG